MMANPERTLHGILEEAGQGEHVFGPPIHGVGIEFEEAPLPAGHAFLHRGEGAGAARAGGAPGHSDTAGWHGLRSARGAGRNRLICSPSSAHAVPRMMMLKSRSTRDHKRQARKLTRNWVCTGLSKVKSKLPA